MTEIARKFLIVRIGMTGDSLFALPLVRSVRAAFPDSTITMVVSPRGAELYKNIPQNGGVDCLVTYDFYHPKLARWSTRRKLTNPEYDAIFFLDTNLGYFNHFKSFVRSQNWFRMVSEYDDFGGIQVRQSVDDATHACRRYLKLAEAYGIPIIESYAFELPSASQKVATRLRSKWGGKGRRIVGFHWGNHSKNTNVLFPKESFDGRSWSMDSYVGLACLLHSADPNIVFVLTGGTYERRIVKQLASKMKRLGLPTVNWAGKTRRLTSLLGLLHVFDGFVVGDTGPMHLASAIGVPTAALFFATDPKDTGPYHAQNTLVIQSPIRCAPCLHTERSYRCPSDTNCVMSLSSGAVFEKIFSRFFGANHG